MESLRFENKVSFSSVEEIDVADFLPKGKVCYIMWDFENVSNVKFDNFHSLVKTFQASCKNQIVLIKVPGKAKSLIKIKDIKHPLLEINVVPDKSQAADVRLIVDLCDIVMSFTLAGRLSDLEIKLVSNDSDFNNVLMMLIRQGVDICRWSSSKNALRPGDIHMSEIMGYAMDTEDKKANGRHLWSVSLNQFIEMCRDNKVRFSNDYFRSYTHTGSKRYDESFEEFLQEEMVVTILESINNFDDVSKKSWRDLRPDLVEAWAQILIETEPTGMNKKLFQDLLLRKGGDYIQFRIFREGCVRRNILRSKGSKIQKNKSFKTLLLKDYLKEEEYIGNYTEILLPSTIVIKQKPVEKVTIETIVAGIPDEGDELEKNAKEESKAYIQYYCQVNKIPLPEYCCIKTGEDHMPIFTVRCLLTYKAKAFTGRGTSGLKKESEKLASWELTLKLAEQGFCFPPKFGRLWKYLQEKGIGIAGK